MFFWIILGTIIATVVGFTGLTAFEERAAHKKWNKAVFKEIGSVFAGTAIIASVLGTVLFLFVGAFTMDVTGYKPQVVKSEVFNIPANSTFDTTQNNELSFTYIDSHGSFAGKTVKFDNLFLSGPNNSVVVVYTEDKYYDWFAPFPWGTDENVLVH